MLNQGQGTYPQLAGSFYNSQQMMPHDNGRNAHQVPTFFGGLQNMMSASTAMNNFQGVPLNQSILNTQSLASHRYSQAYNQAVGHVGTGLSVATTIGGLALGTNPIGLGVMAVGAMGMAGINAYKKRMSAIEDMRNAMEGTRLGYGLTDPLTGGLTSSAALNLSRELEFSASGSGFKNNDLKQVMGMAGGMGMLNGMQNLGEVTKKVTDLAKASREIVMLGEGISMTDAMQLQKLTQDMGISTSKFRGSNIGRNLVMAARAAGTSIDMAAQVGGQGAATFQQLGLGAASGMNAAFFSNMAAKGLTGAGVFSQRQLAALGGEQGVAQNLLMGQASTMARMSDTLVMGAVKLGEDGQLRVDRNLLDSYVRGDISAEDMQNRAKNIGKGMSKRQRSQLLESIQFAMPELKEQMSDMLNSEEMMAIQAREILGLKERTGLSMKRAAHAYFGDAAQAESFLAYSQNFRAVRAETRRQGRIADREETLRKASMAKSSGMLSRVGRGLVKSATQFGEDIMYYPTLFGEKLADSVIREEEARTRGMDAVMGVSGMEYSDVNIDLGRSVLSGPSLLRRASRASRGREGTISFSERVRQLKNEGKDSNQILEQITGSSAGMNRFLGGGLGEVLTEFREGEYSSIRSIGDMLGIDDFMPGSEKRTQDNLVYAAKMADQTMAMGNLIRGNTNYNAANDAMRNAYHKALGQLREVSLQAAKGRGEGDYGGASAESIMVDSLRRAIGGTDTALQDAAIAEAYRTARGAGGEFGSGFAKLFDQSTRLVGAMQFTGAGVLSNQKRDTLELGDNTVLSAKGLSAALADSNITDADLNKLINAFMTNPDLVRGDGGIDSIQGVLSAAGISTDYKGQTGSLRAVINSISQAQLTRGKTTVALGDVLRGDTNIIGSDGQLRLKGGTTGIARNQEYDLKSKELNKRLKESLGEGGQFLVQSLLADNVAIDGVGLETALEKARNEKLGTAQHQSDLKTARARQDVLMQQLKTVKDPAIQAQLVKSAQDVALQINKLESGQLTEEEKKQKTQDYYSNLKDTGAMGYDGTLKSYLEKLAKQGGSDEEQVAKDKAFKKLLRGDAGAELQVAFDNFKARTQGQGLTADQRKRETEKFLNRLVDTAVKQNVNITGKNESRDLGKLLDSIAGGIDDFRKAMKSLAKVSKDNTSITIQMLG